MKYIAERDIVLLGAGGHAKGLIEIIQEYYKHINVLGLTDNDCSKLGQTILGIPIIGTDDLLAELYDDGLRNVFISIGTVGNNALRERVFNAVKQIGFSCMNVIHGKAIISKHVTIGEGNVVLAGVVINADTSIGDNCIINTGSIIEHDCRIGNDVHIAPGVKIAGNVKVEKCCMVGLGANIIQGVTIGENSIIGAGSVVINDIPPNSVAVGVPAKVIKRR